jgi:hypothetical protein
MLQATSRPFPSPTFRRFACIVSLMCLFSIVAIPRAYATAVATTTSLAITPATPQVGGTMQTLTATVTATSGGGSVHPGVVNFYDLTSVAVAGTSGSNTARPLLIGTAQLTSSGTASLEVILGGGATHNIHAVLLPMAAYATSTSSAEADVISPGEYDPMSIVTTGLTGR